jgi:hypothetical protein
MNKPEHLINWLKAQEHLNRRYVIRNTEGMTDSTLFRLLNGKIKPAQKHYDKLLPICKALGYVELKVKYKPMEKRSRK